MSYLDLRLPVNVEKGAQFGPQFSTDVIEAIAGTEQRKRNWAKARGAGDIGYALRQIANVADSLNYIRQVAEVFLACGGKDMPFRYRDHFDYDVTDERFGTGDGADTTFQLTKTYDPYKRIFGSAGTVTYVRDILLPVATPTIKVAGVTTVPASIVNGLVTFSSAPANGAALTWTGQFDLLVRFDTDKLDISMQTGRHAQIGSIPIYEVIGANELV